VAQRGPIEGRSQVDLLRQVFENAGSCPIWTRGAEEPLNPRKRQSNIYSSWTISSEENQFETIRASQGDSVARGSVSDVVFRAGDVGYSHSAIEEVEKVPVELPWLLELAGVPGADEGHQLGIR